MIEFDPEKDRLNMAKHGISLARASEMEVIVSVRDPRFEEQRYRAYGMIDDELYCLAYTMRLQAMRVISLRRSRRKELFRYVEPEED
jgi:uncharacterized DUF497 family protein